MGNFSRDTFKLTSTMYQQITGEEVKDSKHYVGVRLQQGVPLVDADWNELEDIRKYEQRAFLKWVVGDGVPKDSDGFRIMNATVNDFTINNGICFVNGWEVINIEDKQYTKQDLYNNNDLAVKWGVAPLPPLQMGSGRYTVYLDVWEREVDSQEDGRIVNDVIGVETCVRLKREWVVRVAGGDQVPVAKPDHAHYKLSILDVKLNKRPSQPPVHSVDPIPVNIHEPPTIHDQLTPFVSVTVIDLRRTGLAVLSEEITIKDGNVGIGITDPVSNLDVLGYIRVRQGSTSNACLAFYQKTPAEEQALVGMADDNNVGFWGRVGVGWGLTMNITNGNVGIGTTTPTARLSIVAPGADEIAAESMTFRTSAGTLGTNKSDKLPLASIGCVSPSKNAVLDNISLGISALRVADGIDYDTVAINIGIDLHNNLGMSSYGPSLLFQPDGLLINAKNLIIGFDGQNTSDPGVMPKGTYSIGGVLSYTPPADTPNLHFFWRDFNGDLYSFRIPGVKW